MNDKQKIYHAYHMLIETAVKSFVKGASKTLGMLLVLGGTWMLVNKKAKPDFKDEPLVLRDLDTLHDALQDTNKYKTLLASLST